MLKWLVLAIVIIGAGLVGLYKYSLDHATEEGSFSAKVYERTIEKQLLTACNALVKEVRPPDDENTPAQYAATCECVANEMFEKVRTVPPDELESYFEKDATKTSLQNIIEKCGYAAGLN
ncbi:MAG: hypothetical protein C0484_09855 [Rhodospirillum sp.]|nr:hypothetical protein [Rhodospirillum sp.]